MTLILVIIGGLCWTWVYIEIIRKGLKDKTYGMPLFALALNLGWELLYTLLKIRHHEYDVQGIINVLWVLFDFGILYTYFRYGYKYFSHGLSLTSFYLWSMLVFITSFLVQYYFYVEFGELADRYSAFIQNLLMSILFIDMLIKRGDTDGQSQIIAINRWVGTLVLTIVFGVYEQRNFILVIGLLCSVFDIIYIFLLYKYQKQKKLEMGATEREIAA